MELEIGIMKISVYSDSEKTIGGGWSFLNGFKKYIQIYDDIETADIIFIPSSSMVGKTDKLEQLKKSGKKIVLRVDNAVRDSRNRGAGMAKMKRIAQMADYVVYQCKWARDYLQPYLKSNNHIIIYNGIDTDIFNPQGLYIDFKNNVYNKIYLYSRFNRDETKRWEKAWYDYQMIQRDNSLARLIIVGKFSDELVNYNFDFFMNENFHYLGIVDSPIEMAKAYRGCDVLLAPYYNDCYSNTIQEAMACGLEVICDDTGGNPELLKNGVISARDMVNEYINLFEELCHHTENH